MYMVVTFGVSCGKQFCNVLSVHDTADQAAAAVLKWVNFHGNYTATETGDYITETHFRDYHVVSYIGVRNPAYENGF